jgi:hypothetical protein
MSTLEDSCQEVLIAWMPSIAFLFIVLLRDWLYGRRQRSATDQRGDGPLGPR